MEYHKTSEMNLAGTDLILLLGKVQDIKEDFSYEIEKAEAFLVPCGTFQKVADRRPFLV